ncbi:hypothetical protein LCGC14_2717170, partial [marine sediment metagenome]
YVDSNGALGSGRTPASPVATVDAAINLAAAGDFVYVAEAHAETLANATSLVMDKIGIKLIGLGRGTRRPTFTMSAAGSNIPISKANCEMRNFLFKVGDGPVDVTKGITVTGTDVLLEDLHFTEQALAQTDEQFVAAISLDAGSDRACIRGFNFLGSTGDGSDAAIEVTAVVTGIVIEDPVVVGDFADACIHYAAAALECMLIRPVLEQRHATVEECIDAESGTTGFIISPRLRGAINTAAGFDNTITAAGMQCYDLQIVNNAGESSQVGAHAALDVSGNLMAARVVSTAEN